MVDERLGLDAGDGEADPLDIAPGFGIDGAQRQSDDPDQLAAHVDQRAARVAPVDRRIGLDQPAGHRIVFHRHGSPQPADDAGGDAVRQRAQRAADRHDAFAEPQRVGIAPGHGIVVFSAHQLQQRQIGFCVAIDIDRRQSLAAVRHQQRFRLLDHVVVGQDVAARVDHDARTRDDLVCLLGVFAALPTDDKDRHHGWVDLLDQIGQIGHVIGCERRGGGCRRRGRRGVGVSVGVGDGVRVGVNVGSSVGVAGAGVGVAVPSRATRAGLQLVTAHSATTPPISPLNSATISRETRLRSWTFAQAEGPRDGKRVDKETRKQEALLPVYLSPCLLALTGSRSPRRRPHRRWPTHPGRAPGRKPGRRRVGRPARRPAARRRSADRAAASPANRRWDGCR